MDNKYYTHRKNEKILELTTLSALLFFILYFIILDVSEGGLLFFSVLLTGLLFLLMNYGYLWNTAIVLSDQGLTIQRRIEKNSSFPWSAIRRIVLRQDNSLLGKSTSKMVVFLPGQTQKIIVSDLKYAGPFWEDIESIAAQHELNVVYQKKVEKQLRLTLSNHLNKPNRQGFHLAGIILISCFW